MRPALKLIVALLLIVAAQPAQAARFTGNYLLEMCASDEKGKELVKGGHAVCQSYIASVIDYHNLVRSFDGVTGVNFCVPEDVPLRTLQTIVTRYLLFNRGQHGSFSAAPGVAMALFSVYPCKGQ